MRLRAFTFLFGLLFTYLSAWGSHSAGTGDGERMSKPVLGGTASNIKQVVRIRRFSTDPTAKFHCSSTVVGEQELITAAHCVETGKAYQVNVGSEESPVWEEVECVAHRDYPRASLGALARAQSTRETAMQLCDAFKSGRASEAQVQAARKEHFGAQQAAHSLTDAQAASDLAACRLKRGKFPMKPAAMRRISEVPAGTFQHVGFGCTGFGTRSPVYPEHRQGGRAKLAPGIADNADSIRTLYTAGDSSGVGVCFGDSGGFLGAAAGDDVSISGVHSTSGVGSYDLDRDMCIFRYTPRLTPTGATSVNLFSSASEILLKELEAKGWRFAGRASGPPPIVPLPLPPGLVPAPLPLPDGGVPPITGTPREPFFRIGGWRGGLNEYYPHNPSNPNSGILVVRDSGGRAVEYHEYTGDPRSRTSIRLLPGAPPGFVDGRPTTGPIVGTSPAPISPPPVGGVSDPDVLRRWEAAGQPVQDGLPVIRIGVSHPPLTPGQVYMINGRKWRFVGGSKFTGA